MRPTGTYLDCFSVISGASAPKLDNYKPQISPKLAPGEAQNLKYWLIFVVSSHKQTYVTMTNRLAASRRTIGLFFSDFWSSSPQIGYFWAQISPKLAPGEAQNLKYWLIFVVSSHKQTYVTMTNRLAASRRTIGLFFSDFWSSSPQIGYFWAQISPKLAPGEAQNLKYWLIFVVSSHKQTYVTMTNRLAASRRTIGLFFSDFWSSSPQIGYFWAQISSKLAPDEAQNLKFPPNFKFSGKIRSVWVILMVFEAWISIHVEF